MLEIMTGWAGVSWGAGQRMAGPGREGGGIMEERKAEEERGREEDAATMRALDMEADRCTVSERVDCLAGAAAPPLLALCSARCFHGNQQPATLPPHPRCLTYYMSAG